MNKKPVIILSFDGTGTKDFEFLCTLPNFSRLKTLCAYSTEVKSVYPSLTYPAHCTVSTGLLPKDHGVVNNLLIQPQRYKADWFWHRKYINGDTIYDLAKRKGYTTGALFWPVSAGADIDYNMPEIWPNRWWQNQIALSLLNGNPSFQIQMNSRFGKIRKGLEQPELDDFTMECALYLLKEKKVDFLLVHLIDLDTQKHHYGNNSKEAKAALIRHDTRLGQFMSLLEKQNIFEEATIIAFGDHSQLDTGKVIKLNSFFAEKGLLTIDKKGHIKNWDVFMNSCDGSCYIYTKNKNPKILSEICGLLKDFSEKNDNCFDVILSKEEASEYGADPKCSLMIEAKKGYYFSNNPIGCSLEVVAPPYYHSTHGYSPDKRDYTTFYMCYSPNVKKDFNIGPMSLLDEAPIIEKIIGEKLKNKTNEVMDIFL